MIAGRLFVDRVFDVGQVVRGVVQLFQEFRDGFRGAPDPAPLPSQDRNTTRGGQLYGCSTTCFVQPFCNHAGCNFRPNPISQVSGPSSFFGSLLDRRPGDAVLAGNLGLG